MKWTILVFGGLVALLIAAGQSSPDSPKAFDRDPTAIYHAPTKQLMGQYHRLNAESLMLSDHTDEPTPRRSQNVQDRVLISREILRRKRQNDRWPYKKD